MPDVTARVGYNSTLGGCRVNNDPLPTTDHRFSSPASAPREVSDYTEGKAVYSHSTEGDQAATCQNHQTHPVTQQH